MHGSAPPPAGTVTFLFTDIEDSTWLWESYPDTMGPAVLRHNSLLRETIEAHDGLVFKTVGDGCYAVFAHAADAVAAACSLQKALHAHAWPTPSPLRVRIALHTGEAYPQEGDYFGPALNRVARLLAAGHGGQTLLSRTVCDQVRSAMPDGACVRDLAAHRLKGLARPEHIFQLLHPDLPTAFPPLRTSEALADDNLPSEVSGFIGQEREMADGRGIAVFLEGLAREAGVRGKPEKAARLFAAAASLREALGAPRPSVEREDYEAHVAATGTELGPEGFALAWSEGWSMTPEQAVEYAMQWNDDG